MNTKTTIKMGKIRQKFLRKNLWQCATMNALIYNQLYILMVLMVLMVELLKFHQLMRHHERIFDGG